MRPEDGFGWITMIWSVWFTLSIIAIFVSPYRLEFAENLVLIANIWVGVGMPGILAKFWLDRRRYK